MAQEGSKLLMGLVDAEKKGFEAFMDYQLHTEMFKGDESELYAFVSEHAMAYAKLPSRKTIKEWAKEHALTIPAVETLSEPHKYYYDKMETRNLKLGLKQAMMDAEKLRLDSPKESLTELTSSIIHLNHVKRRKKLMDFAEDGSRVIHDEYVLTQKNLKTGLKLGWETFDKMAGGLGGGDVVSLVGRPGMGKTYMALYGMIHAWHQGMTTLFVSMEMKNIPIAQRIAAMATKTSIGELKSAQVATKKYRNMHAILHGMEGSHGMWIADGALSVTVEDLQMLCSQLQPDCVIVDGAYLMRHSNSHLARHERINRNQEDMKQHIAEGLNIPIIQTLQLNREAAKKLKAKGADSVDLEDIAGSDAVGQISSAVLGLFEEESIETALQRKVRIMKGRNGEQGEFIINWRFGGFGKKQSDTDKDVSDIMNFHEIIPEKVSTEMKFV